MFNIRVLPALQLAFFFCFLPLTALAAVSLPPQVTDINKDPLNIIGVQGDSSNPLIPVTTTYGGASLTVDDSDLKIEAPAGTDPYSAGLAGYNAPLTDGKNGAPTTINNSYISIIKGNLTSGMDSNAIEPGVMNIQGNSPINLQGEGENQAVIYGYGLNKNAGQLINIENSHLVVSEGKQGTILTNYGTVNIKAGSTSFANKTLSVESGATLLLNTGVWKGPGNIELVENDPENISVYNINDKGLVEVSGGVISSDNPLQLEINLNNGGAINVTNGGGIHLQNSEWSDGASINVNGAMTISGANSSVWGGKLVIGAGAAVTLESNNNAGNGQWATLSGYKGVSIEGGAINLGAGAEIQAGSAEGMQIKGGEIALAGTGGVGQPGSAQLRFSKNGENAIKGGTITVSQDKYGSLGFGQKTTMSGGSIIAAGNLDLAGSGVGQDGFEDPPSFAFDVSGGAISVAENGSLNIINDLKMTVSGGAVENSGTVDIGGGTAATLAFATDDAQSALDALTAGKINILGNSANKKEAVLGFNGNLEVELQNFVSSAANAGEIGIGESGRLQSAGTLTLNGDKALNIAPTGTVAGGSIKVSSETLSIDSGILQAGISGGVSSLTGGDITVGQRGKLLLGDGVAGNAQGAIEANLIGSRGNITVANGDWTLGSGKSIDIKSGALQIGGLSGTTGEEPKATLDVTQGILMSKEAGAADDSSISAGVGVLNGGTLIADFGKIFNAADGALQNVEPIYLADQGAITLTNTTAETLASLDSYRSNLLANQESKGTVNWQDLKISEDPISGADAEAITGANVFADNNLAYGESDDRYDETTQSVAVASESSIGGKTLVLQGEAATAATTITVGNSGESESGNTLTLLGKDAQTNLITQNDVGGLPATNITTVAVQQKATLQLGSDSVANDEQGGKLNSNVTLADGAQLVAAKGAFSTGNITALDDASTQVIVKAGSSLSAPVVGSEATPISAVEVATNSGLNVARELITENLKNAGELIAGNSITASNVSNSGSLKTETLVAATLTHTGGNLDLGSLTLGAPDAPSASEISGGKANIKNLTVTGNLNIGGGNAAPVVSVAAANLGSGRLVFDHTGNGLSRAQINSFGQNGADMDVFRNSIVTVGNAPSGWVDTALAKTGLTAANNGAYNSVLAVYTPITLKEGGSISVGGDLAPAAATRMLAMSRAIPAQTRAAAGNTLVLGNKSVLLVNGPNAASGNGAIIPSAAAQGQTTAIASVSPGAKIALADARPQTSYVVLGVNPDNGVGWKVVNSEDSAKPGVTAEQIVTDNPLMTNLAVTVTDAGALMIRSGAATPAAVVFPQVDGQLAAVMDKAFANNLIGVSAAFTQSGERGTQFLSRALVMANDGKAGEAGRALESAGRLVAIGAAPQMTFMANQAAGSAVTQRSSLAEPVGNLYVVNTRGEPVNRQQKDFATALWIMPLFQSYNGFSMSAGQHDYDFSGALGGVALGVDYTVNDMGRFGVAFNIGGGYAEGSGSLNKTTNNMNFWGIGAYAGVNQDNLGLTADIFYTSTYNELRQDTPGAMNFGKLKADVNGEAVSAGLRAEYKIPTEAMDIIPHAGFRYTNLKMDSYKVKSKGTVIKGDTSWLNVWQFPFGVAMSRVIEMDNGWRFKPMLDLNVTPAAGDFKTKNRIRFTGTGDKAELETKVMDYITYGGTVGFEFGNDNLSVGVNYNGEFGEETSAHGVFGTLRYEF